MCGVPETENSYLQLVRQGLVKADYGQGLEPMIRVCIVPHWIKQNQEESLILSLKYNPDVMCF